MGRDFVSDCRERATLCPLKAQYETLKNIRTACEFAGIEFTDDEKRPGVRLAEDRAAAFLKAMTEEITGIVSASLEVKLRQDPSILEGSKKRADQGGT